MQYCNVMTSHKLGVKRLLIEAKRLRAETRDDDEFEAYPMPNNIFKWYFLLKPSEAPYKGGFYVGCLLFPRTYPSAPPQIEMRTPSGRFETQKPICFSISNFHPETWNPAWSVRTIVLGVLSFLNDEGI